MKALTLIALAGWALCASEAPADNDQIWSGAAVENITPPLGIPMAGYYHAREASDVHDDLYARAIVLKSGDTEVAMVSLDLTGILRPFVEEARQRIEDATGIPASSCHLTNS